MYLPIQAALLRPQLAKLAERHQDRKTRVAMIRQMTQELVTWLRPVDLAADADPAYYKLAWSFVPAEKHAELREELLARLTAAGAPMGAGFRGFVGRSKRRCEKLGPLTASKQLSQSTILLHHPILLAQKEAAQQVAQVLDRVIRQLVS